jgi:DnaA family protein
MIPHQLTLPVEPIEQHRFSNFIEFGNKQLVSHLKSLCVTSHHPTQITYVGGERASGKTHLLLSLCQLAEEEELSSCYIDLERHQEFEPRVMDDLDLYKLICIDNFNLVAEKPDWELAMFALINKVKQQHASKLVITAVDGPKQLADKLCLPDLGSRLTWGVTYQLAELLDEHKSQLLIAKAAQQGFDLPIVCASYLCTRYSRNLHDLMNMLAKLAEYSLRSQRKITLPFIKEMSELADLK